MEISRQSTRCTARCTLLILLTTLLIGIAGCQYQPRSGDASVQQDTATKKQDLKKKSSEPVSISLFDGKSLGDWKPIQFGGRDEAEVVDDQIIVEMGYPLAGIVYDADFPKLDYRLELDAKKITGTDFFCCLNFPVRDEFCSLVVGGWGGTVTGISCINGEDASENNTQTVHKYNTDQWYRIRVEVREDHVKCWIDDQPVVDLPLSGITLSLRVEVEPGTPLGLCSFSTSAAWKNIRYSLLPSSQ